MINWRRLVLFGGLGILVTVAEAQTAQNPQAGQLFYNNTAFSGIHACFSTVDEVADDTPFSGTHHVASFTFAYDNAEASVVDAVVNFYSVDSSTGRPGSLVARIPITGLSPTPNGATLRTVNLQPSQEFDWTAAPGIYGQQSVAGGFVSIQFSQSAGWCEAAGTSLDGFIDVTTGQFVNFGGDVSASFYLQISETLTGTTLSSLTVKPASVEGGNSAVGTVVISSPAPQGGLIVKLASDKPALAAVPTTVTVAVGKTQARFAIRTRAVSTARKAFISASSGDVTKISTLTLVP